MCEIIFCPFSAFSGIYKPEEAHYERLILKRCSRRILVHEVGCRIILNLPLFHFSPLPAPIPFPVDIYIYIGLFLLSPDFLFFLLTMPQSPKKKEDEIGLFFVEILPSDCRYFEHNYSHEQKISKRKKILPKRSCLRYHSFLSLFWLIVRSKKRWGTKQHARLRPIFWLWELTKKGRRVFLLNSVLSPSLASDD